MIPSQLSIPEDVKIEIVKVTPGIYSTKSDYEGVEEYFPGRLLRVVGSYNIIQPPFTDAQIRSLNAYQREALKREDLREFLCSKCNNKNIQAVRDGLLCVTCNTLRNWVPRSLTTWKPS